MSSTLVIITDAETEPPEFDLAVEEVYQTLRDVEAPADAKRDAALKCWQLAEHRSKHIERRRQTRIAGYGDYPHVGGLLLDCVVYQDVEEVQWRALRALVQLAYDNAEVSWLLLHNWVKEARVLVKEEDKVLAELKEQVKKDVANVDEKLRAQFNAQKEAVGRMKTRPMGPAALMSVMSDARTTSWRVKECAFHVANNMANSCWEAHDIILKDSAVKSACTVIESKETPDFVISAAVGFLCSLSYRPASRKTMLDQLVVPALAPIIRKDQPSLNSMSAVLTVANIAGHLKPEQCPAMTKDLQIAIKTISAMGAALARQAFGGRYGTIWKVTLAVSALCDGEHNLSLLASNGAGSIVEALLQEPNVNPIAQEHACKIVLQLSFEPGTRSQLNKDAPQLPNILTSVMSSGMTALSRATAEAALWAMQLPPALPPTDPEASSRNNHLMISHQKAHLQHAQCLAAAIRKEGYKVVMSGGEGTHIVPNLSEGVANSGLTMVLLSRELLTSPLSRAELLVAAATSRPVVWLQCDDSVLPGPEGWMDTLPKNIACGAAGAALSIAMTHLGYDALSDSLQPRDAASIFFAKVVEVVSRYIVPQTQSEAEKEAAREAAERALMAERVAQTERVTREARENVVKDKVLEESRESTPLSVGRKVPLQVLIDMKVDQVKDWFSYNLGLPQYGDMLSRNAVDGLLLLDLTDEDLYMELRIEDPLHRSRILRALNDIIGAEESRPGTQNERAKEEEEEEEEEGGGGRG